LRDQGDATLVEKGETLMKTFANVRKLWRKRPFEPFRIVTDAGHYDVLGPEYIMVTTRTLVVGEKKNKDGIFDSARHLGVLQVVAIEPLVSQSKK
jgi:hypothetical protein